MKDILQELVAPLRPPAKKKKAGMELPGRSTLQEFLENEIVTDKGYWSFAGLEPLREIVTLVDHVIRKPEPGTEISVLKAEQTTVTTLGLGLMIYLAAQLGRNVGYFLPTDKLAHKFGRTRLKRMIAQSSYLSGRLRDAEDPVNQATVKEFDGHFCYLLGLESMLGAISTPLDALLYDEVDLLPAENREWSQGRVAASDLRTSFFFSAGYSPGAGIDERYQAGTQHKYLLKCVKCGKADQCLEDLFPESMAKVRGKWLRVCAGCHEGLDLVRQGRWVAMYSSRAKERKFSYRVPSLILPLRDADHIMQRWELAQRRKSQRAKFDCAELAKPNAGAMQPVTDADLIRMRDDRVVLMEAYGEFPRYAGMDTGDLCHFYCYERLPNGQPRLVWIEEIDSDHALERGSQLLVNLGVRQFVPDKKPLTTLARAFAYKFPRLVALQDFTDSSEMRVEDEEHEGKTYRCVKVNRDESLDDFTAEIADQRRPLLIPSTELPILETFAKHLKNLKKERTIDAKGRAIDKYLKGVANHFGMAGNSARIAEQIAPMVLPFSWTPIDGVRGSAGGRGWGHARSLWGGYRG